MKLFSLIVIDDYMPPAHPRAAKIYYCITKMFLRFDFFSPFLKPLFYVRGLDCKTFGLLLGDVKS